MSPSATRPFYRYLGIEVTEAGDGRSVVRMPATPELLPNLQNERGDVHGGAIATLLDAALANAARAALPPDTKTATIQFTVHYMLPGRGTLVAEGRSVRAGTGIVTAEGHVRDEAGTLVAQALGTFRVLKPR